MIRILLVICLFIAAPFALGQDFYDVDTLRTVDLTFHDANWWNLLEQNYQSQTNILADLTVEGVTYPDVGVRIRGNTSYVTLPPGAEKVSLNVETDFVHEDQEVMGYKNFNFNNAHRDPTFCREVVYFNILARWIPSGRANHIILTLNGSNWGVYANIQQYDKTMLEEFFADEDGLRIKCANNPNGPGLQYMGTNPSSYSDYEIKDDGGFADPMAELIALCNVVDNTAPANWQTIDQTFAIDPSIWTVVLENLYSDDDSYVHKGADFMTYRNPDDGRTHLHQTDGNETWTDATWSPTFNFGSSSKPVLSNVLNSTEMRGRYFAHYRAALEELDWTVLNAEFTARRNLIDAAVQADPKKLYTYQMFINNFTSTVNLGGGGPGGGSIIGIQPFVTQRRALLLANAEVAAVGPTIQNITASSDVAGDPVYITATVTGASPIASVYLYYRESTAVPYQRIAMEDDGLSGDGSAGDDVFGALLPFTGTVTQQVAYYVGATAQNTYLAQSFLPQRTELDPLILTFAGGPVSGPVLINEFLAKNDTGIQDEMGEYEDWVELYNDTASLVDLSGAYLTDDLTDLTKWQIPASTYIDPFDTLLIWTDDDEGDGPLHSTFKLSADGEELALVDTDGTTLLDSVVFGAQEADISTGRLSDGQDPWVTFLSPSPDMLNAPGTTGFRTYSALDSTVQTLSLEGTGTPELTEPVVFETRDGPLNSYIVLFICRNSDYSPIDPSGTVLLVNIPWMQIHFHATDGAGAADHNITLPNKPSLVGKSFYLQSLTDANGFFEGSNGLEIVIGL